MSTKLNAEELAAKAYPRKLWPEGTLDEVRRQRKGYEKAIREVAQPIADERDELREKLTKTHALLQQCCDALAMTDHAEDCGERQPRGSYAFANGCNCGKEDTLDALKDHGITPSE